MFFIQFNDVADNLTTGLLLYAEYINFHAKWTEDWDLDIIPAILSA